MVLIPSISDTRLDPIGKLDWFGATGHPGYSPAVTISTRTFSVRRSELFVGTFEGGPVAESDEFLVENVQGHSSVKSRRSISSVNRLYPY